MAFETIVPPAPVEAGPGGVLFAWRRPIVAGVGCIAVVGIAWWIHPVVAVVAAAGLAGLSWRLRRSPLSPWRRAPHDNLPVATESAQERAFATGLRWRWEDACVNAGLGSYIDDRYSYEGLRLVGLTSAGTTAGVIAHAALTPGQSADAVAAQAATLALGLESASARVVGTYENTVAILIVAPEMTDGWT
ncbi:hypothetical protein [Demequina sp.]|uniref:hypothetical protein n=1 Tax=Demequina sp. TaxID=2050685 RepID=UPI003A8B0738